MERDPTRLIVWSYQMMDYETRKPRRRNAFFHAGDPVYGGEWLGPSDCVWFVPVPNPWATEKGH